MGTESDMGEGSLLKKVAKRMRLKEQEDEERKEKAGKTFAQMPYLPTDCVSNILVRLPLESLSSSRLVCKAWYGVVNDPVFVNAHFARSESVLICLTPLKKDLTLKPNFFLVESKLPRLKALPMNQWPVKDAPQLFDMSYLEIRDGIGMIKEYGITCMGKIRASCNGLIMLDNGMIKSGLIVMNPVTRELISLPYGTLCSPHQESYGLAFCNGLSTYKLVHLFQDILGYVSCEVLSIGVGSWRAVDGPPYGHIQRFKTVYEPVYAIGALHWAPRAHYHDYIVSMSVEDEKFERVPLPKLVGQHDRVVEIDGFLGFLTKGYRWYDTWMDVWILRGLAGEKWERKYRIRALEIGDLNPLYTSHIGGEIIFISRGRSLYVYDLVSRHMRKLKLDKHFLLNGCFLPHVNSFHSWRIKAER